MGFSKHKVHSLGPEFDPNDVFNILSAFVLYDALLSMLELAETFPAPFSDILEILFGSPDIADLVSGGLFRVFES